MALDHDFDFACSRSQRHSRLSSNHQTLADCIRDVIRGFCLDASLAHATGNSRTLGDIDPILIAVNADQKFRLLHRSEGVLCLYQPEC